MPATINQKLSPIVECGKDVFMTFITSAPDDQVLALKLPTINGIDYDALEKALYNSNPVSKQKVRRALGMPKPSTKKSEYKQFKKMRKSINADSGMSVLRRNGRIRGVHFYDENGNIPRGRAAVRYVLRYAALAAAQGVRRGTK